MFLDQNSLNKETLFEFEFEFLVFISNVSTKPNTCVTKAILVLKYFSLKEQSCGTFLVCPRSTEHTKNDVQNYMAKFKLVKSWKSTKIDRYII